jgi:hypothetical protein
MDGPIGPDLREPRGHVGGFEKRNHRTARSADSPPPLYSAEGDRIGNESRHHALHYTDLLRTLDAIGETVDLLNSQVRALLTRVGCELARETEPQRDPD